MEIPVDVGVLGVGPGSLGSHGEQPTSLEATVNVQVAGYM
jgi:hypothetical protein